MKKYIALSALVCALALPALANSKHPVERPFTCVGTAIWTVDMVTGEATGYHTGVATHAGRVTAECTATWDLGVPVIIEGEGTSVAANGDELFWIINLDYPMAVQLTGGTGRFQNASGLAPTVAMEVVASEEDPDTGILTIIINYTLAGTITY